MDAYGLLIRRHQNAALRVAASIVGSNQDACDIVQDAFVRLHPRLATWRGTGSVRSWMLRAVANEAKNHLRARSRRRARDDRHDRLEVRAEQPIDEHHEDHVRRVELATAFAALAPNDRDVLGCRFVAELSEAETAEVLGTPAGTVKSRTSRALDRLRKAMES